MTILDPLLTVEETCEHLHISRTKLHELIADGRIPSYKPGKRRLFKTSDIDAYLQTTRAKDGPYARFKRAR